MALMDIDAVEWWTFDLVREALVEAAELWRRTPGEGRWPFAADGPYHLMSRDGAAGDYDARGGFGSSSDVTVRPLPLGTEECDRRDVVSEWLRFINKDEDRRLVGICCVHYATGRKQLPWDRIMREMGVNHGKDGLRKRFDRAIGAIAEGLNTAETQERNVSRGGMTR